MSSSPTPPPEGTFLPRRQRPKLGALSKDQTEKDLWLLDDSESTETGQDKVQPRQQFSPKGRRRSSVELIPEPETGSEDPKIAHEQDIPPVREENATLEIKNNASKKVIKPILDGQKPLKAKPPSDFDDLEQWDEPDAAPVTRVTAAKKVAAIVLTPEPDVAELPEPEPEKEPDLPEPAPSSEEEISVVDEPEPTLSPISIGVFNNLSKMERIGLVALAALLPVCAILIYAFSFSALSGSVDQTTRNDFPVKGNFFSISAVDSYWRQPITEGPNAESFRRGTQLIPVLELSLNGGPGAVRVFFKDGDGAVLGDVVTRSIEGSQKIQIPATYGFDDIGMHSAYRTGQTKPWTADIYEADAESSSAASFKKLLRINISTTRR